MPSKYATMNNERMPSLEGNTPREMAGDLRPRPITLQDYKWQKHCGGLVQLPIAA